MLAANGGSDGNAQLHWDETFPPISNHDRATSFDRSFTLNTPLSTLQRTITDREVDPAQQRYYPRVEFFISVRAAAIRRSLSTGTKRTLYHSNSQEKNMSFHAQSFPSIHMRHPRHTVSSRVLYQPSDDSSLSQYQCVVRQQLELFR